MSDTPRTDALEEKWRYATEARGNLMEALDDMFNEYGQLEQEIDELRNRLAAADNLAEEIENIAHGDVGELITELRWHTDRKGGQR